MADHLTEEEQIESIKRWWSDNWLSIVMPIALAALAYTGWNYWGDHKEKQAQQASQAYQMLTQLMVENGPELTEEARNEASTLADDLRQNYAGSLYADMSTMILAKLYFEEGKLDQSEAMLRDVVEGASTESVLAVAKSRLAIVLLEQGEFDQALAQVSPTDDASMKALYAEIRGDIYLAQGETAAAHTAYQEALAALLPQQRMSFGRMLQFKIEGSRPQESGDVAGEPKTESEVESAGADVSS